MQTLLIVEDDAGIAAGLEYSLTQEGFGVVRLSLIHISEPTRRS